eukprot:11436497-Ditylum_brightwellii.AAC.1
MHESDYEAEEDEDYDEEVCKQTMERVQRDEEDMHGDDLLDSDDNGGSHDNQHVEVSDEHPRKKDVWCYKLEAFLNHFMEINFSLLFVLGTCLSLDEMIISFSGRSNETYHIKNKPIQKGYKFFALTTTE